MVRKLSVGSRRRSSKASNDGSLSENMAKPAIRALPREISGSSLRGSGMRSKADRSMWKRASADRFLRAFLAETTMISNSFCAHVKISKLGKYSGGWLYEREDQNQRFSSRENSGRELLACSRG